MKHLLLSLGLTLLSAPALALSCMPANVAQTYKNAADAEEAYIIVHGTLVFDETKLPRTDFENQQNIPANTLIPARLTGKSLSKAGFQTVFEHDITLNAQCFGPWCAGARSGLPYLAFLERTDKGYVLALTPCGGFGFSKPSPTALENVTRCLRGGHCKPAPLQ